MNILLDEKDFEKLTKGAVVQKDEVQIALSDIGYDIMFKILDKNYEDFLKKNYGKY